MEPQTLPVSAIDMSQFFQVFFEETEEHLDEMERLLVGIDTAAPTADDLNAIFRAAHSIKGGSGTFGFRDLADLTHEAETLLDRVRKSELDLSMPMIDALLESVDALRAQLAQHRGRGDGGPIDVAPLALRLRVLAEGRDSPAAPSDGAAERIEMDFLLAENASWDNLVADLAGLGTIESASGPDMKRRCIVVLRTSRRAEVEELVKFVSAAEPDPGYGLFEGDTAPASEAGRDPGFGLFEDAPGTVGAASPLSATATAAAAAAPAAPSWGRRATDRPEVVEAPAGRRAAEKLVVAAQSDGTSIRVNTEKVDQLINLVGELVITQAMLAQRAAGLLEGGGHELSTSLADLERNTRDLQEAVLSIRMLPMSFVFNRYPRMLRDLAAKLGKQVELKTIGEHTELDKGVIEKISDPMTHLVRNSIDHGIESPEARIAAGKPAQGTLTLCAEHQGGNIVIQVADDGKGLDRSRILAKARERGLRVHDAMTDAEVWQLIFEPGFSTAEQVTDVSGRGVGMDVVKKNIIALGGSVELESATGHGTRVIVRLPLTLAIMDGMSIAVRGDKYIIPLASVVEILQPDSRQIKTVSGQGRVVEVRSEYLPVVSLSSVFGGSTAAIEDAPSIMVIVEVEGAKTALLVDELLGQHQVVVKSLEANYRRVPGISGATIMGDGHVALIIDIAALVRLARH